MGYTKPYIPRADADFNLWAAAYCNTLNKAPASYMMTPAETADLMHRYQIFAAALLRATNEGTRNTGTIAAKDDARSVLKTLCRQYAAFIRCNDGIDDQGKINAGVRPRNIARNERNCEGMVPALDYIGSLPGLDQLAYIDANTKSKAKPRGAERLELWVAYTATGDPKPKPSAAILIGSFKKSKMIVDQDAERDARIGGSSGHPTFWARWVGYDGQPGPWSLSVSPSRKSAEAAEKAAEAKANRITAAAGAQADASHEVDAISIEGETDVQPLKRAA